MAPVVPQPSDLPPDVSADAALQQRLAALEVANDRLRRNFLASVRLFMHFLEMRSPALAGHAKRVAELCRRIAHELALPEDEARDLHIAALVHDIGFTAIPEAVMNKPVARFTPQEMQLYQKHPVYGAQALLALDELPRVAAIVRAHHERFDGEGFPDKLAGEAIPRGARVLALASAYDDLLHTHITGTPLSPEQARTVLRRGSGRQFDPEVLSVFLRSVEAEAERSLASVVIDARDLRPGMRLSKDLISKDGILLLSAGHELNDELIRRVRQYALRAGVELPVSVLQSSV